MKDEEAEELFEEEEMIEEEELELDREIDEITPDEVVPSALNCKKLAFSNFKFVKYCETFAKEYGSAFKIDPLANKTIKS